MYPPFIVRIVCGGAAFFALVFFTYSACVATVRMARFRWRAFRAEGVVTEARMTWPGVCDADDVWTLTIEYEDDGGVNRRGFVEVAEPHHCPLKNRPRLPSERYWRVIGTPTFDVGDSVAVWYDPDRPEVVYIASFAKTWLPLLALDLLVAVWVPAAVWLAGDWLGVWSGDWSVYVW